MKRFLQRWCGVFLLLAFSITGCTQGAREEVFSGTIEAQQVDIQSEAAGRLKEFIVEEGLKVKSGQLVARIEDRAYQIRLKEAEAVLKAAQSRLADARAGSRDAQIEQAAAQVRQIEASLAGASKNLAHETKTLEDYRELQASEGIPDQQVAAQANKVDSLEAQIQSLEAQKKAAEAQLKLLEQGSTVNALRQLSALAEQAEAQVESAKLQLQNTAVTAPASGIIQRKNFEAGELVSTGSSLAVLLQPDKLWVTIYIPENKLNLVSLNQEAQITADAYPGKSYKGKITYIANEAEFTPKNMQTKEDRVKLTFAVKVELLSEQDELKPGMPVDVALTPKKEGK